MSGEISGQRPDGTPYPVQLDDHDLAARLDRLSFQVLREAATERAFSGEYTDTNTVGVYRCKACDGELFRSETKFHSGCGWPSFYAPAANDAVVLLEDHLLGYPRIEVRCARCGSHLGHVFRGEGYPVPTDERWCINSVCLTLEPAAAASVVGPAAAGPSVADRFRTVAAGFTRRVEGVAPTDWSKSTPCDGWVALDVVRHLAGWIPAFVLATWEVTYEPVADADADPLGAWSSVRDALERGLDDPAVASRERDSQVGRKTFAEAVEFFVLQDVLVHTWDLARATGQDDQLDEQETGRQAAGLDNVDPGMDEAMRSSGHFGARIEVAPDASAQTRLLAFVGRDDR